VRIIGGKWRGRRVRFPANPGVRPTPDRVRETLFNWLGQDLTGIATLEVFAGSGALSFEALSRGAALAVAVDRNADLVRALRATATALGTSALEVYRSDAIAYLAREARLFDVIFLDPPFANPRWSELLPAACARMAPKGSLYLEAPAPLAAPTGLSVLRSDKAGQVHYHLLRRVEPVQTGSPC